MTGTPGYRTARPRNREAFPPVGIALLVLVLAGAGCEESLGPAVPTRLDFVVGPVSVGMESPVVPDIVVAIRDQAGETVRTWSEPVTLALESGTDPNVLTGTMTVTPTGGTAVFDDLRIGAAGSDYRLVATSAGLQPAVSEPFAVHTVFQSTTIATGRYHTCALTADGTAYCWGANTRGQVGDGTVIDRPLPTPVATELRFVSISAGDYHTCGLTAAGTAFCWGTNHNGELGAPTTQDCAAGASSEPCAMAPVPVSGAVSWDQLSAGRNHTCGLAGGRVYCWGSNSYGQLGVQDTADRAAPAPVAGTRQFKQVSAGFLHTCALATGGEAYCWGSNIYGEVGDSSHVRRRVPTPVLGDLRFTSISAGGSICHGHTCAIATDGTTHCWGKNYQRYINAYTVLASTPQPLAGDPGFASVTVGGMVVCGITAAGALHCWGDGHGGQVGIGNTETERFPVRIRPDLQFTSVQSGQSHTCGVSTDGTTLCWGSNGHGQLGNGSNSLGWMVPVAVWAR